MRARRREQIRLARHRRRVARVDVGVGATVALLALVFGPGLAPLALVAFIVLAACTASVVIERHRGRASQPARNGDPPRVPATSDAPRGGRIASAGRVRPDSRRRDVRL